MRPEPETQLPGTSRAAAVGKAVVLRPGIALPVMSAVGCLGTFIAAVIFAYLAHAGGDKAPMPPAGDWKALGDRLIAGIVLAIGCWGFFKVGSQRIVLDDEDMRIVTFGAVWTVPRNAVSKVVLAASALTIVLKDGTNIRPSMFWSSPTGVVAVRSGQFANFASRQTIAQAIRQWSGRSGSGTGGLQHNERGGRYWRARTNLLLLAALLAIVVVEAIAVTAWAG
jgi:hypothetical protein